MRVHVFAVGRLKAGPERELSARYLDRFAKAGPAIGLEYGRLLEVPEGRSADAPGRKRDESAALTKAIPDGARLALLDERGKAINSEDFANLLGKWRDAGTRDAVVMIGGADGHDDALREKAEAVISFGRMTWPHQLVRIMAAEQIYRAVTILAGHPYHRA
jgi:23S rRNA (pseudouridine1915-N3)-methyltransferase